MNVANVVRLIPRAEYAAARAAAPDVEIGLGLGTPYAAERTRLFSIFGVPCNPPPWGTLAAVDLAAGTIRWQVPLGSMAFGLFRGLPNLGGPIVTASGLVFIAAANDDKLRAFDVSTGRELWQASLPAGGQATPMTYVAGGRQFVVIAAGGHARMGSKFGDAVVAFALPEHWIACRPRFLLAVPVLSRLFRRLFLESLNAAYQAGRLQFFADQAALSQPAAFQTFLTTLRKVEWVVYAKRPFGGPDAVLAYLSRYTHRTAIANSRLVAFAGERVTFKWKDYRAKGDARYKLMTLDANEFIRRFLIHVLPDGFHRIRHYGLFANAKRANNIALARRLLAVPDPTPSSRASDHAENGRDDEDWNACPCCGGRMIIVEAFAPGCQPRFWPVPSLGLDSS